MIEYNTVLVIGAHYDDIELGCGGTIARLIKEGAKVTAVIISNSEIKGENNKIIRSKKIAKKEGLNGLKILGIKKVFNFDIDIFDFNKKRKIISKKLNQIVEKDKYDTLFTHWCYDPHTDHREIGNMSIWLSRKIEKIFQYRSNYYMSDKNFKENYYFDISSTLELKKKAPISFDIGAVTVDPGTEAFDPRPLIPYMKKLGVPYYCTLLEF